MNGFEWGIGDCTSTHKSSANCDHIDGQLELEKFWDGIVHLWKWIYYRI